MKSNRLDQELVDRSLVKSREEGKRLILAGEVLVSGHVLDKPAAKVTNQSVILVKERPKYVSRGGLKLEHGLNHFGICVDGRIGLDIGSSTGGFTDCLLQRGALKVYAFDVGTNQLAWKIRQDDRVVVREKFNCRQLTEEHVNERPSIIVADVSFISLTKLLKPAVSILDKGGELVVLIKPQFELERDKVGKGGVIKDPHLHQEALDKVNAFAVDCIGLQSLGHIESPIKGASGNTEFLAWFRP